MAYIRSYELKSGVVKWEYFVSRGRSKKNGAPLKIHKRGFLTKRDAEKAAKIIEGQIASGAYFLDNPSKMTLEKYLDIWLTKHKQNVKEGTRIVYKDAFRMYVIPYIGNVQLGKYDRVMHQEFINQLFTDPNLGKKKNGLSWNTVKTVNGALHSAFKKAIHLGYIQDNPCLHVEFPDDKRPRKKDPDFYTLEQTDKFLEFASKEREPFWYVFFLFIFDLGLRKGEAMALRWSEIDLADRSVQVTYTRLYRKEGPGEIYLDYTKTESGIRKLLLTNRLKSALIELFNSFYGTRNIIPITSNNDDFIFTYQKGTTKGYPVRDRSVNGASDRIMKKAKLPKIKVHDGRHTNAVRLRQAGVPLEDIKDLLGHKDIDMTQIYAHVSPEIKERSMEKLESLINEKKA